MNKAQRSKIKINGLQAQNTKLHEICTKQREAITKLMDQNKAIGVSAHCILAAIAEKYGEKVQEDGKLLGYRISYPAKGVKGAEGKYDVKFHKDDLTDEYVIGFVVKEVIGK